MIQMRHLAINIYLSTALTYIQEHDLEIVRTAPRHIAHSLPYRAMHEPTAMRPTPGVPPAPPNNPPHGQVEGS